MASLKFNWLVLAYICCTPFLFDSIKCQEEDSDFCSRRGTFHNGLCLCNEGYYGQYCECDTSALDDEQACKISESSGVCSGHGVCICGVCDRNPIRYGDPSRRFSGQYCECDDYSCDYFDNMLCGGPDKGVCRCGECVCKPGYTGTACACTLNTDSCMATNGLICNGKGRCECGACTCDLDTYYRGATCEDCPTCPGRCERLKSCVQCLVFGSGDLDAEQCYNNCRHNSNFDIQIVDNISGYSHSDYRRCRFLDTDDCIMEFVYAYNSPDVYAQITKECPPLS